MLGNSLRSQDKDREQKAGSKRIQNQEPKINNLAIFLEQDKLPKLLSQEFQKMLQNSKSLR